MPVGERAKLCRSVQLAICLGALGCVPADNRRFVVPVYDQSSGWLMELSADQNRDGRLDQWTYLIKNRPLRGEADLDDDGRIDQWEYFDDQGRLSRIGTSSRADGIEDTWDWVTPADGEARRDLSRRRDRQVDRREFRRGGELVRAEEDTNMDGRPDRWDRYEGQVIREAAFDTTFSRGRPNYRLLYDAKGQFTGIESDAEGDGTFVRLTGEAAAAARAGVQK